MNPLFLVTLSLVLSLGLLSSVSTSINLSYGQQNQTANKTSPQQSQQGQQGQQQQNQSQGIGSASEIESLTAGNAPVLGNATQKGTSLTEGIQKEQATTDTNMTNNQTGGGAANGATNTTGNQTQAGGNQTEKNPLQQLGETISGIFGGNRSK